MVVVVVYYDYKVKERGDEVVDTKRLKQLRLDKGLSQVDIAKKIGVSINTYRNWEYGVTAPSEENLKKLLEVINRMEEK